MAQTIGEYLYRIAWSLDKSGAANLKKEGDAAQKSVDGLGKSLDHTEQEAKDLSAAADKTSKEIRDVGDASREATTESSKLNDTANAVTSSLKRMVAGLASIAAVKRAFSAIISTATEMDALANSAAAVGASAAGMARLAYATDLAGVNASEMDSALKGVRQSAAQAAAGIGAGVEAWQMIGISTRDENGNLKDTTKLIDELGVKFAQMDEGRAQALGKLLKLTPMVVTALRNGMMDYAKEFDGALGSMTPTFDEAVKAAQELHAAQSRLGRISGLLWQGIASRFFEPFAKAFDSLRQTIIINQAALVRFGAAVLQPLALLLSGFAAAVGVVSNALTVLTGIFDALGPVSQTVVQTLLWGAAAYALALHKVTLAQISAAASNPFVLIGAAITAVMLLLDDFATAMRGGKTYFNWDPAIKIFKSLREWGTTIEEWITSLPDKISKALTGIWETLRGWWTTAIEWMSAKWDAFVETVTGWMPDALKKQIGISVEGSTNAPHPQFVPVSASPAVARALSGPAPIAIPAATPGRLMTALADAQARAGGSTMINEGGSVSTVINNMAAGGRVLGAAQPLGSTTINSTDDHSRKYDIPITLNNSPTVNITNMGGGESNAGQITGALDASNAKLVRDMQSPLAVITDEPQTLETVYNYNPDI